MKLEVRNLAFAYSGVPVLKDISFSLQKGDFLSVLGANGAGKTTLFKCILGILNKYSGVVASDGVDLRTVSTRKLASLIAYIPQINRPSFAYSVLDTVLMSTTHRQSVFASPGRAQTDIARAALERIGILYLEHRSFSNLSGGEQQLVLVARALAQQSEILIMDEPTASLDYGNQLRVLDKVRTLSTEGYTVLLSTHDPQHALSFSNRLLAIKDGRVAVFGNTAEKMSADLISELYGIRADFVRNEHGCAIMPTAYQ